MKKVIAYGMIALVAAGATAAIMCSNTNNDIKAFGHLDAGQTLRVDSYREISYYSINGREIEDQIFVGTFTLDCIGEDAPNTQYEQLKAEVGKYAVSYNDKNSGEELTVSWIDYKGPNLMLTHYLVMKNVTYSVR